MKTLRETLKILGISRNTLKKRAKELNVTPYIDDYGWWHFTDDDIETLKGYRINYKPTPPLIPRKVTNKTKVDVTRDTVMVGNNIVDVTYMTEDDVTEVKHLASLYDTQGTYSRHTTIQKLKRITDKYK